MAKNERFDCDNLAVTGGTSFSQLLFADDDVLGLDVNQIFKYSNNNSSVFPAEKTPRMLCFENFPNRGEIVFSESKVFSESTQKSGLTCSDSSSSASSSNNISVSTMSKSSRKRSGSDQESVQCTSTVTTTCTVPNQRTPSKKIKAENPISNVPAKRKEKLGERITALQQLVSPFGKTDTASVLHEAMGYIRFLQEQVQVLCSPYLQRLPSLLDKEGGENGERDGRKDLRSRGLCLIPVECTVHVANANGADLWSPAMASNVSSSTKQ